MQQGRKSPRYHPVFITFKGKEAVSPDNRKAPTFIVEDRGEQSRYHPILYS